MQSELGQSFSYGPPPGPPPKGAPHPRALIFATLLALVVAGIYFYSDGLAGLILLYLAVLPVGVILTVLRFGHENDISASLYAEMLLLGSTVSIGAATVLEGTAQSQARPIWKCEMSPNFTWQCDVLFIIAVVISVALTEEFSKFLPLSRLKRSTRFLPRIATFWFRKIETPRGVCLAGCAAAAGFAVVENIKYIFNTGRKDLEYGIDTSIARSVLAVPFHVVCTGYAASVLAERWFVVPPSLQPERKRAWWDFLGSAPKPYASLRDHSQHLMVSRRDTVDSLSSPSPPAESVTCEDRSIFSFMSLMCVPVILHGLYDSGLFLASQLLATQFKEGSQLLPLLSTLPWAVTATLREHSMDEEYRRSALTKEEDMGPVRLAVACLCVGFLSYLVMMSLFYRRWQWLKEFQRHAIPRLHRHFTNNIR